MNSDYLALLTRNNSTGSNHMTDHDEAEYAAGFESGVRGERSRWTAIMGLPEASGRFAQAAALAGANCTVEQAANILRAGAPAAGNGPRQSEHAKGAAIAARFGKH